MADPNSIDPSELSPEDQANFLQTDEQRAKIEEHSSTNIEIEAEQKDSPTLLRNLWESFKSGRYQETTQQELLQYVEDMYFGYEPINDLTKEEEAAVKRTMFHCAEESCNRNIFKLLIENDVVIIPPGIDIERLKKTFDEAGLDADFFRYAPDKGLIYKIDGYKPDIYASDALEQVGLTTDDLPRLAHEEDAGHKIGDFQLSFAVDGWRIMEEFRNKMLNVFEENGLKPLPKEEKEDYFGQKQCENWNMPVNTMTGSLRQQGVKRGLDDYIGGELHRDGMSKKIFFETAERVRSKTRKDKLNLLDVGGGIGQALKEAQDMDPNIETFLLVAHDEPAHYPVDNYYLCPGERMPKNFYENQDLVISNIAFRYFNFPDIALMNVIESLSVGGEAYIAYADDRSPRSREETKSRYEELNRKIKDLADKGIIQIDGVRGDWHITKLKSLKELEP